MSRSNPALTNPATRFFQWKGGDGKLEFYDKEKQVRVNVPLPFTFMVLDELATITGFCKPEQSGYWSNEVRSTVKEELHVRTSKGTKYIGLYKNDQGIVQMPKGATYAKSIYIAYKTRNGYEIGNIKASGSALGAWIEFGNTCVTTNGKITMTKGDMQESPVGEFYAPVFTWLHTTPEEDGAAIALDKDLQVYLSHYLAVAEHNRGDEEEEIDTDNSTGVDMSAELSDKEIAELPVEKQGTAKAVRNWEKVGRRNPEDDEADAQAVATYSRQAEADTIIEDIGNTPINLDEIPF